MVKFWGAVLLVCIGLTTPGYTEEAGLIVGSEEDFPPLALGHEDHGADGFTVELWKTVARTQELHYKMQVLPFFRLLQEFREGRIDVLINLAKSDERRQFADFSVTHVEISGAVFTRKKSAGIQSENDLTGKSIIVINADLAHDYAVQHGWQQHLILVETCEQGMRLLASGQHDAMLVSRLAGLQTLQKLHIEGISPRAFKAGYSQKFAFAVHKNNPELLAKLNEGLALAKADGSYDAIYEKWLGIYTDKSVSFGTLLPYLLPLLVVFSIILAAAIYKRRIEQQAAKVVAAREAQLSLIYESVGDAIILLELHDQDHCSITAINRHGIELVGLTPQCIGQSVESVWPLSSYSLLKEKLKQCASEKHKLEWSEQNPYCCDNKCIAATISPITDSQLRCTHLLLVMRDVSETTQLRNELADRERLYSTLLSNLSGMAYRCRNDSEWTMDYVSDGCHALTGYPTTDLMGNKVRSFGSLIHGEDSQRVAESCEQHLRAHVHCSNEYRIVCADGSIKWVWDQAQGIYDHNELLFIEGFITDITVSKKAQIDLENALAINRKFGQALDRHALVSISDSDGLITYANDAFCQLTQYDRSELLGKNNRIVNARYHEPAFFQDLWDTIKSGQIWKGDICNRAKDGSLFWVTTTIVPYSDNRETPVQYVAIRTDITAQKTHSDLMEQALQRELSANRELLRLNRTMAVMSRFHELLVHISDEMMLLAKVCELLVETGNYQLAWIGFPSPEEFGAILPMAHSGVSSQELEQLNLSWADNERGQHAAGQALRDEKIVVLKNIDKSTAYAPLRSAINQYGVMASIGLPLRDRDRVFGCMVIAAHEENAFDSNEIKLLERLACDLGYGVDSLRQRESRLKAEEQLEVQTNYDPVTGLINRSLFNDRLHQTLSRASRSGRVVSVLAFNVDRFKNVNESLGYSAGDILLKLLGQRLVAAIRAGDSVARLSADEFALLLEDVKSSDDILPLTRKLIHELGSAIHVGGQELFCSFSVGISIYPKDGDNADSLLRNAEAALRNAKSLGGNTMRFYTSEMNTQVLARMGLKADLHRAMARNELLLHYQPKVNLQTGQIVGAEALVRWLHPQQGLVPPSDFIGLAEETGLILEMGLWVADAACAQVRRWLDAGLPPLTVAINVSARQFQQTDLARQLRMVMEKYHLPAEYLQVEITESMLIRNMEQSIVSLNELKAMGLKLSLDDFGTGFSSLSYLKRLPVDYLKIDRSFVKDLINSPEEAAICRAIIGLAHTMRLKVIAEGVETESQMHYLRRHLCDEMQGFFFSRPLPADEYAQMLLQQRSLSLPVQHHESSLSLLIVHDDLNELTTLTSLLNSDGYRIHAALTISEAFEVLSKTAIQVVLTNQQMMETSGTEFLARVKDSYPDTVRLVLSEFTHLKTVADAINHKIAFKYFTKPLDNEQLKAQIKQSFELYAHQKKQQEPMR